MPPDRLILEWTDVAAMFLRSSNWIVAGAASGPIVAQMQAISNGAWLYATQGLPAIGVATPVAGQYQLVQDVALLNFATVPGTTVQLVVPAPLNTVFGPNSTIVDITDPGVAALVAQVVGVLADSNGNAVTAFVSGSKASRRVEQI